MSDYPVIDAQTEITVTVDVSSLGRRKAHPDDYGYILDHATIRWQPGDPQARLEEDRTDYEHVSYFGWPCTATGTRSKKFHRSHPISRYGYITEDENAAILEALRAAVAERAIHG